MKKKGSLDDVMCGLDPITKIPNHRSKIREKKDFCYDSRSKHCLYSSIEENKYYCNYQIKIDKK